MYIVRKRFQFSAAHRLRSSHLSDEENEVVYGKCGNPNFHGHNYNLEVAVAGKTDSRTGMVINFDELKKIVNDEIVEELDHRNLNLDVDFLKDEITTAENLARIIFQRLSPLLKNDYRDLYEITLAESDGNIAVFRNDDPALKI